MATIIFYFILFLLFFMDILYILGDCHLYDYLKKIKWMNEYTRSICIESSCINKNVILGYLAQHSCCRCNLYSSSRHVLELHKTGLEDRIMLKSVVMNTLQPVCRIQGFHSNSYECCHCLGYSAVCFVCVPVFWTNAWPPSSGKKIMLAFCCMLISSLAHFWLCRGMWYIPLQCQFTNGLH
jgi:hypothetical protein